MDSSEAGERLIRERAVRVFTFLRELARLKSKVIRDLGTYPSVVWFKDVPEWKGCFSILSSTEESPDGTWLEVQRPAEPERPSYPPSCGIWIDRHPDDDPLSEPKLKDEIVVDSSAVRLADQPEIVVAWNDYLERRWRPWAGQYKSWQEANNLYFQLFSIHQQMEKLGERYQLLLGVGLLTWETPNNQLIRRHVVVGDACLTFDADRAKLSVQGAPEGVKLRFETDMVDLSSLPPVEQQKVFDDLLTSAEGAWWNSPELQRALRSWVQSISPDGLYSESQHPPVRPTSRPTVTFAPALILRERTQRSQVECFNKIVEQIDGGGRITPGVHLLCEISEVGNTFECDEHAGNGGAEDHTIYFPLPVNEEQLEIARQVRDRRGILVQGPPGTGKSHTIANLICHLLAQGKRVLITSQGPRALKVLKDKIPPEVAALCVTLLGNDQSARDELKESVRGINDNFSTWNPERSRREILSLQSELYECRKAIADTERLLREQREVDTRPHRVGGGRYYEGTALDIARRIKDDEPKFGWLRDNVPPEVSPPISGSELVDLVRMYRELPGDYCGQLELKTIGQEDLPDVAAFVRLIDDESTAGRAIEVAASRCQSLRFRALLPVSDGALTTLAGCLADLSAAVESVRSRLPWVPHAISDVLGGADNGWNELCGFTAEHLSGLPQKAQAAQALDISFPSNMDRETLRADARDLLGHLRKGGGLGWHILGCDFRVPQVIRRCKYVMLQTRVNGQTCSTPEQLDLLVTYLDTVDEIQHVWQAWEGKDRGDGGSILLQVAALEERLQTLQQVLALRSQLTAARGRVASIKGLAEPEWRNLEELREFILDIEAVRSQHAFDRSRSALENYAQRALIAASDTQAHPLNQDFLTSLQSRDPQALAHCLDRLECLQEDHVRLHRRRELIGKLGSAAPKLAQELATTFADTIWEQREAGLEAAWAWRQADAWLAKFNAEHNEIELESALNRLFQQERSVVSKLASSKAWGHCLRNLTEHQRAHLIAWANAVRKFGKGTGKHAPMFLRQAQENMDKCKGAIPAWIMPLYRVFDTVAPEPEAFDVVIIDEASQTGPEGLVIHHLAKQCIVVGDQEQIAPEGEFVPVAFVAALRERYLFDIPLQDQFDLQTSLFAHASMRFRDWITLREHFRCMPEIIHFSNDLCYSGKLKPLRQYPPKRLEPIVVRHVKDGFREGSGGRAVNRPEADALVETISEWARREEYAGKTFGVISLQGEEQARYIESRLLAKMTPPEIARRRLICGDAYAFQGDERDVIFLSMVAAPNERIGTLGRDADKRRFNVAASRARDQLVLFHTASLGDLHNECMRYRLLKYCLNPVREVQEADLSKCQSQFERDVCQAIAAKGFNAVPQYHVAGYFVDLVVEGTKEGRLAVECDGDKWHDIERYESDVARQRVLERCGLRFWRIRGGDHYRDPEGSLEPLWKMLSEMNIRPVGDAGPDDGLAKEDTKPSAARPTEDERAEKRSSVEAGQPPPPAKEAESPPGHVPLPPIQLDLLGKTDLPTEGSAPSSGSAPGTGGATVQKNSTGQAAKPPGGFDLLRRLSEAGVKYVDKRRLDGALWVLGGNELSPLMNELKKRGFRFVFAPEGGRATGHRPAWWVK